MIPLKARIFFRVVEVEDLLIFRPRWYLKAFQWSVEKALDFHERLLRWALGDAHAEAVDEILQTEPKPATKDRRLMC